MNGSVGYSRCVPPIRWLQKVFVPPRDDEDWARVAYQPMLYLSTFLAVLTILVFGDFTNIPAHAGIEQARQYSLFWIWSGLGLGSPVLGLGSLWIVQHFTGAARYRGLWLRLAADVGQLTAMVTYITLRISWGDYHLYPIMILGSATLFVAHLVMRDMRRLIQIESLAGRIHRNDSINVHDFG